MKRIGNILIILAFCLTVSPIGAAAVWGRLCFRMML